MAFSGARTATLPFRPLYKCRQSAGGSTCASSATETKKSSGNCAQRRKSPFLCAFSSCEGRPSSQHNSDRNHLPDCVYYSGALLAAASQLEEALRLRKEEEKKTHTSIRVVVDKLTTCVRNNRLSRGRRSFIKLWPAADALPNNTVVWQVGARRLTSWWSCRGDGASGAGACAHFAGGRESTRPAANTVADCFALQTRDGEKSRAR